MKDYLGFENARNKAHAAVYADLMRRAFAGDDQASCAVLIGHHLTFELGGDLDTENEIPSADCLMFDHDIMYKVFGPNALSIMQHLATVPVEKRDDMLKHFLESGPLAKQAARAA